ncbi:MAG: hypothetical protein ACLQUY_15360 [Ktedonobacterales bacterium]
MAEEAWRRQTSEINRIIAYHEAGHAVACLSFGIVFAEVKIEDVFVIDAQRTDLGHVLAITNGGDWQNRVIAMLAGGVAEYLYLGFDYYEYNLKGRDELQARALIGEHMGSELVSQIYDGLKDRTTQMLQGEQIWSQVVNVAQAILARPDFRLTYQEVLDLLNKV